MTSHAARRRALLALCTGVGALVAWSQPVEVRAQGLGLPRGSAVKAAFLYKFGSFVEWPPGSFEAAAPFVIGVFGDDAVAAELELITDGREIAGHPVQVRRVRDSHEADGVHMLFAGGPRESRARDLLSAVEGAVLTVAEGPIGGDPGPVLWFAQERGRVRFGASITAATARGLKLSAKLLAVAQHVEGR